MKKISYYVGVGVRGPIAEGEYAVRDMTVSVSYPELVEVHPEPLVLPHNLSTAFVVSWLDSGAEEQRLRSSTFERFLPIYKALDAINELLLAFKIVRVGHIDSVGLRAIGINDTLFYFARVDGEHVGGLNVRLKSAGRRQPGAPIEPGLLDRHGTSELARPHIGTGTLPVARRYVRCFELLEHGFYTEAFVIAFAILDDVVQQMLDELVRVRGIETKKERDALVRVIKESRLRIYLGPLLKLVAGKSIMDLWPAADKAIDWLNEKRNRIAHSGGKADESSAAVGIFGCMKLITVLHLDGFVVAEFPVEMFRHAKLTASWTVDRPAWVPVGSIAEANDFAS